MAEQILPDVDAVIILDGGDQLIFDDVTRLWSHFGAHFISIHGSLIWSPNWGLFPDHVVIILGDIEQDIIDSASHELLGSSVSVQILQRTE